METTVPLDQRRKSGDFFCQNFSDMLVKHKRFQHYTPQDNDYEAVVYYDPDRDLFFIPDTRQQVDSTQAVIEYVLFANMFEPYERLVTTFRGQDAMNPGKMNWAMNELKLSCSSVKHIHFVKGVPEAPKTKKQELILA